jgi:hypothetical protein
MADFAYSPDWNLRTKPNYNVAISKFRNNAEQRRLISSQKLRKWDLEFKSRDSAEMAAVNTFYDTKYGPLTSFTMLIDGETVTGRFEEDSFWSEKIAPGLYNYGFTFQEVVS